MLLDVEDPNGRGIGTVRVAMRDSLLRRFSKLEETKVVVLACLLDPRFKSHAFSSDTTLSKAKEWLKEDVHAMDIAASEESSEDTEHEDVEQQAAAHGGENDDPGPQKKQRIDDMYQVLLGRHAVGGPLDENLDEELHRYLREPVIDRKKGDPLQWWRQNEKRFKHLAPLARRYLTPPPSSVPSERVFSEVSDIYEKKRNRLTGEHAEQICFLHHNLVLLNWEY